MALAKVPPHARAGAVARGHRFAAYPRCSADLRRSDVAIAIRGLCPLIQVFDMPASLHFYRDILGFGEVSKSGQGDDVGWAWLRHDDACLMLNTAYDVGERPDAPDPARIAVHGDTILYLGCADLDGAYAY